MEDFENYIKSEYKDCTIANFKYNYNILVKLGKISKTPIKLFNIFVNVKFYDNKLNVIQSLNLKFVNNILNKTSEKKLRRIKSEELNKKFMLAKNDIMNNIKDKLTIKFNKIKAKIDDLNEYNIDNNDHVESNDSIDLTSKKINKNKYNM